MTKNVTGAKNEIGALDMYQNWVTWLSKYYLVWGIHNVRTAGSRIPGQ